MNRVMNRVVNGEQRGAKGSKGEQRGAKELTRKRETNTTRYRTSAHVFY